MKYALVTKSARESAHSMHELLFRALKIFLAISGALAGCNGSEEPMVEPLPAGLKLVPVVTGLSSPLYLTAPAGDGRLFIVEQPGRIRVVMDGVLLTQPYLDVSSKITSGGERGLLGMAFHPRFWSNGYFYVNYPDPSG